MDRRLAAVLVTDMVGYSRLMQAAENDTIARQKAHREALIDPEIARNGGTIIKSTGDGLLVVFSSAADAVRAAMNIQTSMLTLEADHPEDSRIRYRAGINIGDVIFDQNDIFGDAVNVAARLECLAEPGGLCLSDLTYQLLRDGLETPFEDLGSQKVKNISRPIRVWQWTPGSTKETAATIAPPVNQKVQFCTAADGVQIAFARVGDGPPVLKAPNWLNHIEYEWRSAVWGPFLSGLARNNELIRFDQRGGGLSDWEVEEISQQAMVSDMQTVVKNAGLDRFAVFGLSQGCAFSIRYAAENPDKVSCLILLGGYLRGALKRNSTEQTELFHATQTMIEQGWGSPNPTYRHFFTAGFIPDATPQQQEGFDELQRVSVAPQNVGHINHMNASVDVTALARQVQVPTLVLHCEGDRRVPMEEGRRIAATIPDAQFVRLDGNNHALIEGTAAFDRFFKEYDRFLSEHAS